MKRFVLFLTMNTALLVVLYAFLFITGLDAWLLKLGIPMAQILGMAVVLGALGGSISLLFSKQLARWILGVRMIRQPNSYQERWLVDITTKLARRAGVRSPELGVYPATELNAMATGFGRNHAMIALSSGLLANLNGRELEAVISHEMAHIAEGDMQTLSLLNGGVSSSMLFLPQLAGQLIDRQLFRLRHAKGPAYWSFFLLGQVMVGGLASMLISWLSRRREYQADAKAASWVGTASMLTTLQCLAIATTEQGRGETGIWSILYRPLDELFGSHPSLASRITLLRESQQ